jgi:DNA-binding IclR family transcriptional regulator
VEGLTSVAAPVIDRRTGAVSAALHVHGPSFRFPAGRADELGGEVMAAASRVAAGLHREVPRGNHA